MSALARRQHGVVSTVQLKSAGFGKGAISWRVQGGWLRPVHRGVYATGHAPLTFAGHCWAAVLACGGPDRAVLSHRTAAVLWDLLPAPAGKLDVTSLRRSVSSTAIRVHKGGTLDHCTDIVRDDDGLPRTSVTRTLIDLADVLSPHRLRRLCHRAEQLRLLDAAGLAADRPGRRTRALNIALAELATADPDITRSELEERFLALLDAHHLPRPVVNTRIHGHEVDFLWPDQRVIVETDGTATHLTPSAFRQDRRRDLRLTLAGYTVARFTWHDVVREPAATGQAVRGLLAGA